MEFEAQPRNLATIHGKGNAFWLLNVQRLDIVPICFDEFRHVVVLGLRNRCSLEFGTLLDLDVNLDDFLCLGVDHRTKVQRMCVLVVVLGYTVVHQCLLESMLCAPTLVESDGPGVAIHLGHVVNADISTELDDSWVSSDNLLRGLQIFQGDGWHDTFTKDELLDLLGCDVDYDFIECCGTRFKCDGECFSINLLLVVLEVLQQLWFSRLVEGYGVKGERDIRFVLADNASGNFDLIDRELIEGMSHQGSLCNHLFLSRGSAKLDTVRLVLMAECSSLVFWWSR